MPPHAGGPSGPQRVTLSLWSSFFYPEAPRSGPRRAPGGSEQREQEMVCYTTFDDPFRTVSGFSGNLVIVSLVLFFSPAQLQSSLSHRLLCSHSSRDAILLLIHLSRIPDIQTPHTQYRQSQEHRCHDVGPPQGRHHNAGGVEVEDARGVNCLFLTDRLASRHAAVIDNGDEVRSGSLPRSVSPGERTRSARR